MDESYSMHDREVKFIQSCYRKSKREKPHGRPGNRWDDNIKMNLKEMGCEFVDSIHLEKRESIHGFLGKQYQIFGFRNKRGNP
jgi:hypothetical protein